MNQHSKRGGQANGNSVDEVRRGATRPAAVFAIILCVGFAVAMVAIWSCGKPPSHQETQTQTEAAVQTETAKPETETSTPGTEFPTPEEEFSPLSVPPRAVSPAASTATPPSQASPAVGQLTDDHVNSPTPAEGDQSYIFLRRPRAGHVRGSQPHDADSRSHDGYDHRLLPWQTAGGMGNPLVVHTSKPISRRRLISSLLSRAPPSYSATVKTLNVAGDTTNDSIVF